VEEAIENVSEFIDTARINNFATLRIIHGMGTGRLRKGIHDYLKTLPYVKEFRLGNYTEGQSGVTIVTLK
ncbi:MAG: Smr/MutS family protein, partial [Clostridia bacterium]